MLAPLARVEGMVFDTLESVEVPADPSALHVHSLPVEMMAGLPRDNLVNLLTIERDIYMLTFIQT